MKLKDILTITGQSGLFKFVSNGRTTIIVESMLDGKRSNVPVSARVSSLADIMIFAASEEIPLYKVLWTIRDKRNGAEAIDAKKATDAELSGFFVEIVPEYDRTRVHLSDIKKIITWYNILQKKALLDFEIEEDAQAKEGAAKDKSAVGTPSAPASTYKATQSSAKASSKAIGGSAKILAPRKAQ